MSKSLIVESRFISQPAATDPVERRSWCKLRIRAGTRFATRVWDKDLGQERTELFVPAFPIAEWIVAHWWSILNEPSPTDRAPSRAVSDVYFNWIKRHCLRCADSSLLLPALYFYHDGQGLRVEWQADEMDVLPNMPGEFVDSYSVRLDPDDASVALGAFVRKVLGRVAGVADERVRTASATWSAIENATPDEASFCVVAGRLGVDPYDDLQMTPELSSFIEETLGDPQLPVARDLAEAGEPEAIAQQWSWIKGTVAALQLKPIAVATGVGSTVHDPSPWRAGYELAGLVRQRAGLGQAAIVPSVGAVAEAAAGLALRAEPRNHVPGGRLRAVVGAARDAIVVAGPLPLRNDSRRFQEARGLYFAVRGCQQSERLITGAHTWDQQAARAFAAELLAPREAMRAKLRGPADQATIEVLAREFGVGTVLIENQLRNEGIEIAEE